jgi:Family of unknown function (DUF5989)
MVSFLKEFWLFLRVRKKFWLLPILLVTALFGGTLAPSLFGPLAEHTDALANAVMATAPAPN